jgi:16S rRNA (cytidine1402-2'-O)-methyltransferase
MLAEVMDNQDAAILSEAGVPGVADPGTSVVRLAHEKGIRVVPLTGPSSILLSLMASGLNGQAFKFHGYLPIKTPDRIRRIRALDQVVQTSGETQIFIEAPYRNDGLVRDLVEHCSRGTLLCIAADLTLETEFIQTRPASGWKNHVPVLHKRPAIFLLGR